MHRALAETIVSCLRFDGTSEIGFARLRSFGSQPWRQTLPWLDRSGLALYFWQHLKATEAENAIPREVQACLARRLEANLRRVQEMSVEFNRLNRCFEEAGIKYAALKGFALIPDCCPEASLRTSYDFDYLLDPEFLPQAQGALAATGYVFSRETGGHLVYVDAKNPCRLPMSLEDSYSAQLGREVELHFRLWNTAEEKINLELPGNLLARVEERTWNGQTFRTLSGVDQLIFQGVHAFWHVLHGGCRMSNLYEVAWFLSGRTKDLEFFAAIRRELEGRTTLGRAAGVVFMLAAELYGVAVPAALCQVTTAALTPAQRLWVERYGRELAFQGFSGTKFGLFLHREFIADGDSWREVRRRSLFPYHRASRATKGSIHLLSPGVSREVRRYMVRWLVSRLYGPIGYALEWPRWRWFRRQRLTAASPVGAQVKVPRALVGSGGGASNGPLLKRAGHPTLRSGGRWAE